jgi:hypothetical protein
MINLKRSSRINLSIPLSNRENAQNAIVPIPLPMESYSPKIRTKYAISAMKELYPRIPKAVIKL